MLYHRLNCRTVSMNRVHRFLYWNMNYHVEHHMFPLVLYYQLPLLHQQVKDDCPPPYKSIVEAWREIVPAILRQIHDPAYYIKRVLPAPRLVAQTTPSKALQADVEGWIQVADVSALRLGDSLRFDHGKEPMRSIATRKTPCTQAMACARTEYTPGRWPDCRQDD